MRSLLILLSAIFLAGCSSPQRSDEEKQRSRLARNKIKTISEFKTSFISKEPGKEYLNHLQLFNSAGFVTKEIDYNDEGFAEHVLAYEYDRNNNLVAAVTKNSDSTLVGREIRNYDEKNILKELIHVLPDGTAEFKYVFRSDSAGRMSEKEVYWPSELSAVYRYSYDGKKKLEETEYSADNKLIATKNFLYDPHGDLLEENQVDNNNNKKYKTSYLYNLIHQVTRQSNFSGQALQNAFSYEYDQKYLLSMKTEFSPSGKITAKYRYEYEFFE
jgi:hypothetical protein